MSEGHQSAQRILRLPVRDSMTPDPLLLHRVDASQLQAPVHIQNGRIEEHEDEDDCEPMTWREFVGMLLIGAACWAVVGVAVYGGTKLAEAMR